jgi:hypothetical protein
MSNGRACVFSPLVAALALAMPAGAQSVISTHSGLIHFFEGAVFLGDQPLQPRLGKFASVPQGGELRTEHGRAEVLLTPGVFLRMGDNSTIRMLSNDLADTQVELQSGSAIVNSAEPNADTSVTLIYKDWKIHFLRKGVYRIDSDPPLLGVQQGEAEVFAKSSKEPISVARGMSLPFASVLVPERTDELDKQQSSDELSEWENGRSQSIVADNAISAQIGEDPTARDAGLDTFTYFPFLDVPYLGMGYSGAYSSYAPYQLGFNSIYLPGYTYRPIMLGLTGRGLRVYLPSPPMRIGVSPGIGGGIGAYPHAPIRSIGPARPVAPVHAGPPVVVHGGAIHR